MNKNKIVLFVLVTLLALPSFASAQSSVGVGLRGGVGFEPDQLVAGLQLALGPRMGVVKILPSVDLGLGDKRTTYSFNADVLFRLNLQGSSVAFFGGAGPTITYVDFEGPKSDWQTGISLIAGINSALSIARGADLEVRFGVADVPDLRIILTVHL